ncbi:hypothetical protein [Chryseobacterium sp. WLY505]|uniref:hypothetical protein n=1 Tax=Chryseobacterium sp. WLY505 TaxID=3068892 RepID=UPI0027964651|nr:hypothetical protein [Chryseobacterium sp. WLY505]MDQ1857258.1 hypothetical protein [Chryseobacterium sp. WLY505]
MKKITLITLLGMSSFLFSQANTIGLTSGGGTREVFFKIKSEGAGRALNYDEIIGSPYLSKSFNIAQVANDYEKAPVRYNTFNDEIEFQKNGTTLALPKEEKFSRIEIFSPKMTLVRLDTQDDLSGYFFELVKDKTGLYKKIKTKFIDAVPAANSYATDRPASFKTLDPVYYIKTESGYIKKPKKIKDITEAFPAKKDEIEKFAKSNNIKINKEEDLIKLVKFLNQ